jgi:hypothetical protein
MNYHLVETHAKHLEKLARNLKLKEILIVIVVLPPFLPPDCEF